MKRRQPVTLRRGLQRTGLVLAGIVLLAYPADWLVWRALCLAGHGMGTAQVDQTTAGSLKGNHFEVYSAQTTSVNCSNSLLPQAGAGACWWLRRHPEVITQY